MHVLFLYGGPACGKLTIGREVAARTGYALFDNHLVVDALLAVFPFGSPEFVRLRELFWIETIRAAVRTNQPLVFTFCPELSVDPAFPERLKRMVEQAGGAISFIRLDVSGEEQERRLVAPSRTGGKLRDIALFRSLSRNFEDAATMMPAPELVIDTTATDAAGAADRIAAFIGTHSSLPPRVRKV